MAPKDYQATNRETARSELWNHRFGNAIDNTERLPCLRLWKTIQRCANACLV